MITSAVNHVDLLLPQPLRSPTGSSLSLPAVVPFLIRGTERMEPRGVSSSNSRTVVVRHGKGLTDGRVNAPE
jgi:hypothetical protein